MSLYDTEFSRRIRSSVVSTSTPPHHHHHHNNHHHHPSPSSSKRLPFSKDADVFGSSYDINRRSVMLPDSTLQGRAVTRDYGDRFIPTRDGTDINSAFQLLPETSAESSAKAARVRRRSHGQGTDAEARREEVNSTFSTLLKNELFSVSNTPSRSASPSTRPPMASPSRHAAAHRRAITFNTSTLPNLPTSAPMSSAGTTPLHHHPPPGVSGTGDRSERDMSPASHLPPLPLHAPSTPTSGRTRAPGAGPSSAQHRAHQSQVTLASTASGVRTPPSRGHTGSGTSHNRGSPALSGSPATPSKKRILNFSSPASRRMAELTNSALDDMNHEKYSLSPVGRDSQRVLMSPRKTVRTISRTPFKVLDAPELADDFYLNLVSWSNSNILGVGLNSCVYLWSAQTSRVTKLCDLTSNVPDPEEIPDTITGLEWTNKGSVLAIGTNRGMVEIWDAEYCKRVRTMDGHTARVGCLAWNNHVLSSGSRDRTIMHRDTRMADPLVRRLAGHHKQEVCGLKWNQDTDQLASGGNDNKLYVWGGTEARPTWRFGEHRAAVKAIAWSPHQRGVLASGGGTADKTIRFWNSLTGGLISEWDTGSQVCNLMWSKNSNELVSTHGYSGGPVQNQIHIWRYPSMSQVATLTGHTYRVLYLAMSPDGQTIVTGAGDETLRFWNAFQRNRDGSGSGGGGGGGGAVGQLSLGAGLGAGVGGGLGGAPSGLSPFRKLR